MSGILDKKSRIIDALLTYEGRRQIADGNFQVKYVSFSDRTVGYKIDFDEGHEDPTNKIYLEAFNAPYDQIVFEADDSGNLVPFRQHDSIGVSTITGPTTGSTSWISFVNGKLKTRIQTYSNSLSFSGSYVDSPIVGAEFASQLDGILSNSIDNFRSLCILGSVDPLFEDQDFALTPNEVGFEIYKDNKNIQMMNPTLVNTVDSLFSDEKLRNIDNFLYLPPILKNSTEVDKTDIQLLISKGLELGKYPAWGPLEKITYSDIKKELKQFESSAKTIYFDPTSRDNELVAQFFEVGQDQVSKLDVIDYGRVDDNTDNPSASGHHIFFVGKVVVDDTGATCFIHLFTLVFSSPGSNL